MEAVCLLFGAKPNWKESKKVLSNMNFITDCKTLDKDNIPSKTIKKLKKYVEDPDFTPEKMSNVSSAATSLCMWVGAMFTYDRVAKTIEPKKKALAEAEVKGAKAQKLLDEKQASLKEVEDKVAALLAKYDSSVAKKAEL
eukprot:554277_1